MTLSILIYRIQLPFKLRAHRIAREARSRAAKQGQSTEIHNCYKRCLATFRGQG